MFDPSPWTIAVLLCCLPTFLYCLAIPLIGTSIEFRLRNEAMSVNIGLVLGCLTFAVFCCAGASIGIISAQKNNFNFFEPQKIYPDFSQEYIKNKLGNSREISFEETTQPDKLEEIIADEVVLFSDVFSSIKNWEEQKDIYHNFYYALDGFEMAVESTEDQQFAVTPNGAPLLKNLVADAVYRIVTDNGMFGLTCRVQSRDTYYYGVTGRDADGKPAYRIGLHNGGDNILLASGKLDGQLAGDVSITLECVEDQLRLWVNDGLIGEARDATLKTGRAGAIVGYGKEMTVKLQHFQITQPARTVYLPEIDLRADAYPSYQALKDTSVPIFDDADAYTRLFGIEPEDFVIERSTPEIGARRQFWVVDADSNKSHQIEASLQFVNDVLYVWVEDGAKVNSDRLDKFANYFTDHIYPTNRAFFGSEPNPGVDGDPHIYILVSDTVGSSFMGYFYSKDLSVLYPEANGHEMFVISALADFNEASYGVLAHEFQHMILFGKDKNEEAWLNEGFSEFAKYLNGFSVANRTAYVQTPDTQLNSWGGNSDTLAHYGGSYLFIHYLYHRLGAETVRKIHDHPGNGLESIDAVLKDMRIADPETGVVLTADTLFRDFIIALAAQDPTYGDGRYAFPERLGLQKPMRYDKKKCEYEHETIVSQYGSDFYRLPCNSAFTLEFVGSESVQVVPVDAVSGDHFLWSNRGDVSNPFITYAFDLTSVHNPVMEYSVWYDIETDYDYGYVMVSTDGKRWEFLSSDRMTSESPAGNNLGVGYTGTTGEGEWIRESIDLSGYAGQKIFVRFEVVTDSAVNGFGMAIDNLAIPEIGFSCDFEDGNCGAVEMNGFVVTDNRLPQKYAVNVLVEDENGDLLEVRSYEVWGDSGFRLKVPDISGMERVWISVSGLTRYTTLPSKYHLIVAPTN